MTTTYRIFVVDDDVASTNIVPRLLTPLGYEVICRNSLNGAFEQAKQIQPQVLLLDVMLRDGVGYQLARQIRKDPQLFKMSILFISSLGETPEIEHALNQGGDSYLVKPISKEKLLEALENMKQLYVKSSLRDQITKLPIREGLIREVDHRLFRHEGKALCCISIENMKMAFEASNQTVVESFLETIAGSLQNLVRDAGVHEYLLSHFGLGTFMLVLPNTSVERVSRLVVEQFDYLSKQAILKAGASKGSGALKLGLRIASTSTQQQAYGRTTEMLQRIRDLLNQSRYKGENLVLQDDREL